MNDWGTTGSNEICVLDYSSYINESTISFFMIRNVMLSSVLVQLRADKQTTTVQFNHTIIHVSQLLFVITYKLNENCLILFHFNLWEMDSTYIHKHHINCLHWLWPVLFSFSTSTSCHFHLLFSLCQPVLMPEEACSKIYFHCAFHLSIFFNAYSNNSIKFLLTRSQCSSVFLARLNMPYYGLCISRSELWLSASFAWILPVCLRFTSPCMFCM